MIPLPQKFSNDTANKCSSIYPFIVIGNIGAEKSIYISQNKEALQGQYFFHDHGLKISSIKESIDIESRNYKINNVSISFSNYNNLSEILWSEDIAIMNKVVYI